PRRISRTPTTEPTPAAFNIASNASAASTKGHESHLHQSGQSQVLVTHRAWRFFHYISSTKESRPLDGGAAFSRSERMG
ncbi:hypothetical protein ABTE65_18885, partial [Acinetobacter baumannii]